MNELYTKSTLLAALIGLGRAAEGNKNRPDLHTHQILLSSFRMLTCADVTEREVKNQVAILHEQKYRLAGRCLTCKKKCGRNDDYDLLRHQAESGQVIALKYALLALIQMLGNCVDNRKIINSDAEILGFLYDALYWLGKKQESAELISEIEIGSLLLQKVLC